MSEKQSTRQSSAQEMQGEKSSTMQENQSQRQSTTQENQGERQTQQDENREDWQQYGQGQQEDRQEYGTESREDWQEYGEDYHGEGDWDEWDGGDDWDDDDDEGRAFGAGVVTGLVVGATLSAASVSSQGCTMTTVYVNDVTYYQCGSNWYNKAYEGGELVYIVVNPPSGY